jgi:3-deoxy-manno-octulosonate cytidylyltransferase (CMP-KDO synthetase)
MIIIPARVGSTRFPNKVLVPVGDIPMVIRTAQAVSSLDSVVIATDDESVVEVAKDYGFRAVITSKNHKSGTDRVYEASEILNLSEDEIIINVQADEPFIESEVLESVYESIYRYRDSSEVLVASAYKIISNPEADDPNIVKVVTDENSMALYFSRAKIPYPRDHHFDSYKGHLGIYAYTKRALKKFCSFAPSKLEQIEKLEQLRVLENGYKIIMSEVETESFGIDTPEDLEKALKKHIL